MFFALNKNNNQPHYVMKLIIILLTTIFSLACAIPAQAQTDKKAARKEKAEQEFQKTYALIQSGHFQAEFDMAYPPGWRNITLFSNLGTLVVSDSIAKGSLPYFGRGYVNPDPGDNGIEFDGKMENLTVKVKDKKKIILYQFSVRKKGELLQISMEIGSSGKCTATVNSSNRSSISYSGKVSPYEEQE